MPRESIGSIACPSPTSSLVLIIQGHNNQMKPLVPILLQFVTPPKGVHRTPLLLL